MKTTKIRELCHTTTLQLNGHKTVPVLCFKDSRARRMNLKINPVQGSVVLTLPRNQSIQKALDFANSYKSWLASHLNAVQTPQLFSVNQTLPLFGAEHSIVYEASSETSVTLSPKKITVKAPHYNAQLINNLVWDCLQATAKQYFLPKVIHYTEQLKVSHAFKGLKIRTLKTRWGSCSNKGFITINWRILLAPYIIQDYLIAHEVSHLVHFNHSKAYWLTVESVCPNYKQAMEWLQLNGVSLYQYGVAPRLTSTNTESVAI